MNTPKIAALILGVGVASAGVTFFLSNDSGTAPVTTPSTPEASPKPSPPESVNVAARPNTPTPPSEGDSDSRRGPREDEAEQTPAPEGIDQDAWDNAQRSMRRIYGFAQSFQDENGRWRGRLEGRVERDSEAITQSLGLEGASAEKIKELLNGRMNSSMEKTQDVLNTLISNEQSYVELNALSMMAQDGKELTAAQTARLDQLKQEIYGKFYEPGQELPESPFRDLVWRNPSSGDWYEDDAFLVKAAAEMPENEGSSLLEYAGKLDYLDRKEYATDRVLDIQRAVNISDEQAQQLNNLYIENRTPTDEQLSQIVPADQLQAVKDAASRNQRRWGRGRR